MELAAGARLRAEVWARRLDSRLDAVLELLDPDGKTVARSHRPREEDAVLEATAAVSGRHVLRLHDRFARGGDDCFYRLSLSTGPTVEAVFPPVVEGGAGSVRLTAYGRGMPGATPSAVADDSPGLAELPIDARTLFGVKEGQDVVIRGTAIFDPKLGIPVIQLTADGIHVRRAP